MGRSGEFVFWTRRACWRGLCAARCWGTWVPKFSKWNGPVKVTTLTPGEVDGQWRPARSQLGHGGERTTTVIMPVT